mmetsp:Transcript_46912/g.101931  ORF Transcript_46912/g.101931 Transcript_46912/m.101931 type:complete len:315 (+) Transcript_46912:1458-2402(+)
MARAFARAIVAPMAGSLPRTVNRLPQPGLPALRLRAKGPGQEANALVEGLRELGALLRRQLPLEGADQGELELGLVGHADLVAAAADQHVPQGSEHILDGARHLLWAAAQSILACLLGRIDSLRDLLHFPASIDHLLRLLHVGRRQAAATMLESLWQLEHQHFAAEVLNPQQQLLLIVVHLKDTLHSIAGSLFLLQLVAQLHLAAQLPQQQLLCFRERAGHKALSLGALALYTAQSCHRPRPRLGVEGILQAVQLLGETLQVAAPQSGQRALCRPVHNHVCSLRGWQRSMALAVRRGRLPRCRGWHWRLSPCLS